jgi:hypothetical protein
LSYIIAINQSIDPSIMWNYYLDLNNAIFPMEDRLIAIARAQKFFNHAQTEKHDEELLVFGAARALYVKLTFAVACHHTDEEIRRICDVLSFTHQCNPHAIEHVYTEIGYELLPLLVRILRMPFADALKATGQDSDRTDGAAGYRIVDADAKEEQEKALVKAALGASVDLKLAVQRVSKILARYSSSMIGARPSMASEPNFLKSLMMVMEGSHQMSIEARCSCLAVLCNLAQHEENHIVMASEPGLLESICKMALIQTDGPHSVVMSGNQKYMQSLRQQQHAIDPQTGLPVVQGRGLPAGPTISSPTEPSALGEGMIVGIRQVASMTLMHLSYGDKDNIPLVDEKALVVLDTFAIMLSMDIRQTSSPPTAQQIHEARRFAIIGLYNFACGDENTLRLALHRKGTLLEVLLTVVTQSREDMELRIISMETLYNMSCCSDGTPESLQVAHAMGIHPGLPMALGSIVRFQDAPPQVQEAAANTLLRLAQLIHCDLVSGQCHLLLLSALVQGSSWTKTPALAQAFEAQAKMRPEHLQTMPNHLGLLNGVSAQALLVGEDDIIRAIRQSALTTILLLHAVDSNRIRLANNEGVMLALTRASFDKFYIHNPRSREEEEFGERIKTVHATLKELVDEM